MMEIKNLTAQDLPRVNSFLCGAEKVNVTWLGKPVVQTTDESFSLHELTAKVLEISSNMIRSTSVERLFGLEILRKIKKLNSIAERKLDATDYSALFTRTVLWVQDHTLGFLSESWCKDHIRTMIEEAKKKICSYDESSVRRDWNDLPDEDLQELFGMSVDGSTIPRSTAHIYDLSIKKRAYKQLLLEPAKEQQKSAEVIEKFTTWCNKREFLKNPGLALMQELLQFDDDDDLVTKEALTFVVSQIPHLVEEACSKIIFMALAKEQWILESDEDVEVFCRELAQAFQTEDSSLNKSFAQAKKCAREKNFDGALQALKQAVEVFHTIEGWSPLEAALGLLKQTVETLEKPEGEWGIADLFREREDLAATN